MVHEMPELYETVVKPYIEAFPPSQMQWYVLDAQYLRSIFNPYPHHVYVGSEIP